MRKSVSMLLLLGNGTTVLYLGSLIMYNRICLFQTPVSRGSSLSSVFSFIHGFENPCTNHVGWTETYGVNFTRFNRVEWIVIWIKSECVKTMGGCFFFLALVKWKNHFLRGKKKTHPYVDLLQLTFRNPGHKYWLA